VRHRFYGVHRVAAVSPGSAGLLYRSGFHQQLDAPACHVGEVMCMHAPPRFTACFKQCCTATSPHTVTGLLMLSWH
jgi:hypothetical protein